MKLIEKRLEILNQAQQGIIDHAEAARLLWELDYASTQEQNTHLIPAVPTVPENEKPTQLRLLKTDLASGERLVDLGIPLDLLPASNRIGTNLAMDAPLSVQTDLLSFLVNPASPEYMIGACLLDYLDEALNQRLRIILE